MKGLILTSLLLATLNAFGQATVTVEVPVVERDGDFEARTFRRPLTNLLSRERLEGVHFKIVAGKDNQAVSFGDDPALVLRAATTYYHLSRARDYFVYALGSAYVRDMGQLTVRVEHRNQYNDLGHFANDNLEPQYNNALTVPGGEGLAGRGVTPWGTEIWFRPSKKVHISELKVKDSGMATWSGVFSQLRQQNRMTTLQRFLSQGVQSATIPNAPAIGLDSVLRTGGTALMIELVINNANKINNAVSRKWFYLDTALVPEIIYHEYAHVALSDRLVLSHSTAVIEGMADFFAGRIANSSKLALDIKKYNVFNGKKATRKQQYQVEFETTDYANSDFVFGMLWDLNSIVGEERVDQFVYGLRERLDTSDSIRVQFIEGILKTCEAECADPFTDKLKILRKYNKKGI